MLHLFPRRELKPIQILLRKRVNGLGRFAKIGGD